VEKSEAKENLPKNGVLTNPNGKAEAFALAAGGKGSENKDNHFSDVKQSRLSNGASTNKRKLSEEAEAKVSWMH
jgi:hypothetical protein